MTKKELREYLVDRYNKVWNEYHMICDNLWIGGSKDPTEFHENLILTQKHKEVLEDLLLSYGTRLNALDEMIIPIGDEHREDIVKW